jgi:hypothetical protein
MGLKERSFAYLNHFTTYEHGSTLLKALTKIRFAPYLEMPKCQLGPFVMEGQYR